jgi:hypothetical protein
MIINELLNLRTKEKKDCKISTNGVIWLRKGEYTSRIKPLATKELLSSRSIKNTPELLIDKVQSLRKNEPDYFKRSLFSGTSSDNSNRPQCKSKRRLYSINKRKVRARLINFNNTDYGDKKMYFYSISFPLGMDEKVSTKLLNSLMTTLRKHYGVQHYLWVAERQKKGQKHYHLCMFHYVRGRTMNEIVKKYLKHAIRKQELNWSISAAGKYNGVDISKDRKTGVPTNYALNSTGKHIARYITKYISKSSGEFEGQAWNSSRSLACISDGVCATIEEVLSLYDSEMLNDNAVYENEWCYFFRWKKEAPPDIVSALRAINNKRIASVA